MALTDGENGTGMVMPVAPMGYGGNYGGGFSGWGYPVPVMGGYGGGWGNGFGGDFSWIVILFLFAMMGGGFGNGWGGGFGGWGLGNEITFPWLLTGQQGINANTNAGFNQAATANTLGTIQTSINTGFSNAEVAACNRAIDQLQTSYNNEIASLNRSFAEQAANTQGFNNVQSQLADCCCEQRLATANLSALVQSENCADREALSNGIRDIITAQTAGTQRILDQLCNDKIDAKNERIAALENQVNMQALAASQSAQTAQLIADNNSQTRDLIQRIAPYPIPSYPVGNPYGYGYGYGYNNSCGWNSNFGFNPFGNVGFGNGSF